MIIVPTHNRHKSPFEQSKAIYIFISGRVTVTVQIHNRKKILKGFKWPLQNQINTVVQQDLCYPAARFNEWGVCRCWVEMPEHG
jgi:hypothetical protein